MSKFRAKNFSTSAYFAIRGLRLALRSQKNVRKHIIIAIIMLFISFFLKMSMTSYAIIILTNACVLSCELFNSVIEFALDAYFRNKYSNLVKFAKDISAGCVLFMACVNVLIFFVLAADVIFSL